MRAIELDTELQAELSEINIIPQDVARVVLNVINNAFYAVKEKSEGPDKHYVPAITITTMEENGHVTEPALLHRP